MAEKSWRDRKEALVSSTQAKGAKLTLGTKLSHDASPAEEDPAGLQMGGGYVYVLPRRILEPVEIAVGRTEFDPALMILERQKADLCRLPVNVGFRGNVMLTHHGLADINELPGQIDNDWVRENGFDPIQVSQAIRKFDENYASQIQQFVRGYAGWLMVNPVFLDEHDELMRKHQPSVSKHGCKIVQSIEIDVHNNVTIRTGDPETPDYARFESDLNAFLVRWRLFQLEGPYLPVPQGFLMAGILLPQMQSQLQAMGGLFFLPDTMPMPSRDQLRSLLEDTLHRRGDTAHLKEWLGIVAKGNTAKNRMDPFGRWFQLQHFFKLLHHRHADTIQRRTGKVVDGLAQALGVDARRIKQDITQIRKRLGKDWLDRPWPI